ncbi:keratin, type I cytoskeletal 18-like isoform X1 [Sceloporus undulatus]|uniref:keratin, type I cytoskeletal 18-like isoform X1 n=1 Tax=Sceloporus undulatus TaxID=8520 RepID=UPI001C4A9DD6|nr:keratin, type I cytoskeletal 18-like isoform X1 [Sceloporus undulatus]
MALASSRPRSGSMSAGSVRFFPGSSGGSVRGSSSGSDSWFSLARLRTALPAAARGTEAAFVLLGPGRQQEALQGLNERLAGYLQRVRGLEAANRALEEEIAAVRARRAEAAGHKDWEACERPLAELRRQVEDLNMENMRLLLQIDNARLAADDFKHKLEAEQVVCDSVQKDTHGLRKMIDDTNFLRLKLEGDLESLREELAHLRKSHKEEVDALSALIANSDVTVQVDNPQKNDLNETIAEIRNQYEKVAEQNRADAEKWYKTKFESMSQEADVNTQALEEAKQELSEIQRQLQGLEIEHQSLQKIVDTLEHTLKNTGDRYHNDMTHLNQIIAKLQDDLAACRADLERQARDYEALLDIKTKLENEIEHYRSLIEGVTDRGELPNAGKADTRKQTIKKVVITTQEIVNGQVVTQRSEEVIQ